jgi:hypothetical protein
MSNLWVTPEEHGAYAETEFSYEAAKAASNLMWALSGRKYSGITTVTERYICAGRVYRYGPSTNNTQAVLVDGDVANFYSDNLDFYEGITADGTTSSSRIRLRGRPVTKIHTVRDRSGKIISPNKYYLVDHSTMQAAVGVPWTPCNIEITYSYGIEPPTLGKMAARTLAIEFAKLWSGDVCELPQRVTSIARQGVSYTLLDSQDFVEDLRTGLYVVDMFLKSVNPDKARAKARVFSPDVPRARRNTPKDRKLATSDLDINVTAATSGTGGIDVALSDINASFFIDGSGWTPEVRINNYSETTTAVLAAAAAIISDPTTSSSTVARKELTSNMAILTTSTAHGLYPGVQITVAGVDATFNGSYVVHNVPSPTTVQYQKTAANVAETSASGTVTSTSSDNRIAITIGYSETLAVLGMIDPGTWDLYAVRPNISGGQDYTYVCSGNLRVALSGSAINAYSVV